jgi:hypothetical protein
MSSNPFIFDRPIDPDDLIDREQEARDLLERAVGGHNSRVASPRRYGKTSLLRRVLRDADREGLGTVYVDFFGATSFARITALLEDAYDQQLKGAFGRALSTARRNVRARARVGGGVAGVELEAGGAAEQERALRRALELPGKLFERTGIRIVVVFDEFQTVLDAGDDVDALFRSVIQHQLQSASYIFAGSRPSLMAALFGDLERPFYGQAAPLELSPLADDDLADYISARFALSKREPGAALSWLLDIADGHPQRAMLLAHLLWRHTPAGGEAGEETWTDALAEAGAWVRDDFERTWERLGAVDRKVLAAVAADAGGLYSKPVLRGFGLTPGGAQRAAERLVRNAELTDDRARPAGLRFVDPLFERWVAAGGRWPD